MEEVRKGECVFHLEGYALARGVITNFEVSFEQMGLQAPIYDGGGYRTYTPSPKSWNGTIQFQGLGMLQLERDVDDEVGRAAAIAGVSEQEIKLAMNKLRPEFSQTSALVFRQKGWTRWHKANLDDWNRKRRIKGKNWTVDDYIRNADWIYALCGREGVRVEERTTRKGQLTCKNCLRILSRGVRETFLGYPTNPVESIEPEPEPKRQLTAYEERLRNLELDE